MRETTRAERIEDELAPLGEKLTAILIEQMAAHPHLAQIDNREMVIRAMREVGYEAMPQAAKADAIFLEAANRVRERAYDAAVRHHEDAK